MLIVNLLCNIFHKFRPSPVIVTIGVERKGEEHTWSCLLSTSQIHFDGCWVRWAKVDNQCTVYYDVIGRSP
jgi:hypothetical protein